MTAESGSRRVWGGTLVVHVGAAPVHSGGQQHVVRGSIWEIQITEALLAYDKVIDG